MATLQAAGSIDNKRFFARGIKVRLQLTALGALDRLPFSAGPRQK